QVEIIAFGKSSSAKLREAADDFLDLCENPRKYLITTGNGGNKHTREPLAGKSAEQPEKNVKVEPKK
ncbi:MAG TPA: hypothetical protein PLK92_00470, partial [Candidatus Paceibacterota bacterium]|nr:hypothetical protein [Candidatus Paceibacterota bacterium]